MPGDDGGTDGGQVDRSRIVTGNGPIQGVIEGELRIDGVTNTVEPQDLAGTPVVLPLPGGGGTARVWSDDDLFAIAQGGVSDRGGAPARLSRRAR